MAGGLEEPVWPVGWRSRYGQWAGGAGMAGGLEEPVWPVQPELYHFYAIRKYKLTP